MSHLKLLIIHIQTPWFSSDKNTHEQASNQTDSSRTSNEPITRNTNQVFTYSSLKKKKSVWKQMEWQRRRLCDVTATQAALCCSVTCCYVTYLSFPPALFAEVLPADLTDRYWAAAHSLSLLPWRQRSRAATHNTPRTRALSFTYRIFYVFKPKTGLNSMRLEQTLLIPHRKWTRRRKKTKQNSECC